MRFYKGKEFNIRGGKFEVYPLGLVHAPKFLTSLVNVVSTVAGVNLAFKDGELDVNSKENQKIFVSLIPHLVNSTMDLFYNCVKGTYVEVEGGENGKDKVVNISDQVQYLPHDEAVEMVDHWVEVSFGSLKKLQPWMNLIEKTMSKVSGQPFNFSDLVSPGSSNQDTVTKTSVTEQEQVIPTPE